MAYFLGPKDSRAVKFVDTSVGTVNNRLWDFGDGQTSLERNPKHTYGNWGVYNVTLTIGTASGNDTAREEITLRKDNPNDVGCNTFYYNTESETDLDPFSTPIPGIGPLNSVGVVRGTVYWGNFEPQDNRWYDGLTPTVEDPNKLYPLCFQLKQLFSLMDNPDHVGVILGLRALSKSDAQFWPFEGETTIYVSHVPKDLTTAFDGNFAYSQEYYEFVKKVMETIDYWGYGEKLLGVVIENEMNSKDCFSGTVDEYCRMVATARKAVKDVFPRKPVYCGGLQSAPSLWVLISKYLSEGKEAEALKLYHLANEYDIYKIGDDIDRLKSRAEVIMSDHDYIWVKDAFNSPLYGYGTSPAYEYLPVDGLNFHSSGHSKYLEII
jgi:PKD repeat protein